MRPIDLSSLITGLLALIMLAATLGQFGRLHQFSKQQASKCLKGWPSQPAFFSGRHHE